MSYENAPATVMLATHCAACKRPLVDAVSVEIGMGPDCREKYGYSEAVEPSNREQANKLINEVARGVDGARLGEIYETLQELGFARLVEKLASKAISVTIVAQGNALMVFTPYNPAYVEDIKRDCRARWNKESKAWVTLADPASKACLLRVLKRHYSGAIATGPKGLFTI